MKFKDINLPDVVLRALEKNKYENLTPIQEGVIPSVQEGLDILGCSQTGSGKTGAFLIPVLAKLAEDDEAKAIVITPTRELAVQIMDNVKNFCEKPINKALLIGGASIREQLLLIQKKPRFIVGTPGRINDFLESKRLNINDFGILVLDEMDRMLDMGFSVQIDRIIENLPEKKQTMLFSATISKKVEKTTAKYLVDPVIVKIGESNKVAKNVSQEIIKVDDNKKFDVLLEKLKGNTLFTLIFVKTKFGTERLAAKLEKENIMSKAIHGDLRQSRRAKIIREFREKKFNVLVATDVAARGLDIHHIDTVINYDLPQSPEDYIHRIGRCSRGLEAAGVSISFCNRDDEKKLKAIQSLISIGEYDEDLCTPNKKSRNSRPRNRSFEKPRGRNFERSRDRNFEDSKNENFEKPLEKDFGEPRKKRFERSRSDNFDKPRGRGFGKSRDRNFGESRGRDFEKPRNKRFERSNRTDSEGSRSENFDKPRDRNFEKPRGRNFGESRDRNFEKPRDKKFGESRGRNFEKSRSRDFGESRGRDFEKSRSDDRGNRFKKDRRENSFRSGEKRDRSGSGYNIEGLMSADATRHSIKRKGAYFISKDSNNRRKKIGLK